jgi:two-component system, NarL family, invasion response regulator UvrY
MIRVLIADDHKLVRTGIKHLLEEEVGIDVIAEATTGEDAVAQARMTSPDVVLLDVSMPGMGGLEAARKLLRMDPSCKIIVVTMHTDGPVPAKMLEVGAMGYLTKSCDPEEMVQAVRTVYRGQRFVCGEIARLMVLNHFDGSRTPIENLSRRELQILVMVSQGDSMDEICTKLCLSPKTVSTYRSRIRKKLGTRTDVELTHIALRHGLIEPCGFT